MLSHSDWTRRSCPNCGSSEIIRKPVGKSARPAEKLSFLEVKDSFVGLRSEQIFFSYFRCKNCSLLYCPWYFNSTQLDELYRDMPDNLMGEDKSTISKTQSGYVNWLSKHLSGVRNYLEIGPDIGLVTRAVIERYGVSSALLVEPNVAVHQDLGKSASDVKTVEIVKYIQDSKMLDFDLVVGIHVYDHLLSPTKDLLDIKSRCEEGAKLLIVVHNEKSLLRTLLGKKWPPFCLQHPQLYNPATLEELLRNSGWKLEAIGKSTNWWRLNHFFELGLKVLGLPARFARFLPKFEIPFKLGNTIALATKIND